MAETNDIVYDGNCHCGRYRFRVTVPEITSAISCSCSLCEKKGYLWLTLEDGAFEVVRDDGHLAAYQSLTLEDKFCNYCGTGIIGEHRTGPSGGKLLLNIRAIREPYVNPFMLEVAATTVMEAEEERKAVEPLPEAGGGRPAQHTFSCHCGKVRAALLDPIEEEELKEDNCSTCMAYIGVYPTKDQVRIYGADDTFEYRSGRKFGGSTFCRTCGVHVFGNIYGPPISIFDKLPPERRELALGVYHKNMKLKPLNVRTLDNLDLASLRPLIKREDEGTDGYVLDS
ncbi:hypothetical protein PT974_09830 [Cladobotryum mycophilum]|uniref:CENP-V/GFA domain-containing protein n=1 Tax=Cladobotryum mycophilum TaxID=491253 RepID=A0ABR0SI97_9HYPO